MQLATNWCGSFVRALGRQVMVRTALLACGVLAGNSLGAIVLTEPFTYANGNLVGNVAPNGNTWTILNSGDAIQVSSNVVTFDGTGAEAYISYTTQNSGTVYYSLDLTVTALGTLNATGGYFAGLIDATSTTIFGATIWTRQDALDTTKYNFGISTRSSGSTISWDPSANARSVGTTYSIIGGYNFIAGTANDTAALWVDTPTTSSPTLSAAAGTDISAVNGLGKFFFRQDGANATPSITADNLEISQVPEPTSMAILGMLMSIGLKRRR